MRLIPQFVNGATSRLEAKVKRLQPAVITTGKGKPDVRYPLTWPGRRSNSFASLNPEFAWRVQAVFNDLTQVGYRPEILTAWRDQTQQDWLVAQGFSKTHFSFHSASLPDGRPDCLAVDVVPAGIDPMKGNQTENEKAASRFYLALRKAAPLYGLKAGFKGADLPGQPKWSQYSDDKGPLGWDPGHIEPTYITLAQAQKGKRVP